MTKTATSTTKVKLKFAVAAAVLAVMGLFWPPTAPGLSVEAGRVAVVALLMAALWMTQALPLAATALIPFLAFPLIGTSEIGAVADAFADPLIFLFLGGFLLAAAMERWGLHRRLALAVVSFAGDSPRALILAVMSATAFLSLWISNTATAMVMTPIAVSLAAARDATPENRDFATALLLGVAFAATIGGIGSLIGTPPNALFAGYMRSAHGVEIGFARWMMIGLPIVFVLLPVSWLMLTRVSFRVAGDGGSVSDTRKRETPRLEAMTREQRWVATVLVVTACALVMRPWLAAWFSAPGLSDAGIAITAALVLFCSPARDAAQDRLLTWSDAQRIRWDVLVLFGGGLALADGIGSSGLASWLGQAVGGASAAPIALLILLAMIVVVYLGELASNTAMAAIFLPVSSAVAAGLGVAPIELALPIALAASLGFMLPVATPPNAIVFGAGHVTAEQMLRAGALLDVVSILIVYALALALGPLVF